MLGALILHADILVAAKIAWVTDLLHHVDDVFRILLGHVLPQLYLRTRLCPNQIDRKHTEANKNAGIGNETRKLDKVNCQPFGAQTADQQ